MNKKEGKIAFFLPSLEGGGAERGVVNLANEFVRNKIDVDLVLSKANGPYLSDISDEVNIIDLNSSGVLKSFPKLVGYLKRERPKTLISSLSHANVVAIVAHKIACTGTRIIVREDNVPSLSSIHSTSLKARFMPFLIRIFYRWADLIIAVSEGVKDDLVNFTKVPGNKVKVIYNPILIPELLKKKNEPVSHEWFASDGPPVIIGVGRLTKQKDFPTLIKAFALVRNKIDARLVILGEGEERQNLENLAKGLGVSEYVWMPGFEYNPYKYMSKASVFVLTSMYEGLANVLVEALACGISVISTDCRSGPSEILDGGKYGKLIPVGDINALNEAITDFLSSESEINNKLLFEHMKKFELGTVARMYLEVSAFSGEPDVQQ